MLWECYLPPSYAWEEFNPAVHSDTECNEVQFLRSNYYLASLYWFHETDVTNTFIGDTLMDQMAEGDASRLSLAQAFESEVLDPVFGLTYAGLIADGVPSHSYAVDYGLVDYAGLFIGLDAAISAGLLPIDGPTYDDLAAYLTGQIADWDAAGVHRANVVAIIDGIIADAKTAAAAE